MRKYSYEVAFFIYKTPQNLWWSFSRSPVLQNPCGIFIIITWFVRTQKLIWYKPNNLYRLEWNPKHIHMLSHYWFCSILFAAQQRSWWAECVGGWVWLSFFSCLRSRYTLEGGGIKSNRATERKGVGGRVVQRYYTYVCYVWGELMTITACRESSHSAGLQKPIGLRKCVLSIFTLVTCPDLLNINTNLYTLPRTHFRFGGIKPKIIIFILIYMCFERVLDGWLTAENILSAENNSLAR